MSVTDSQHTHTHTDTISPGVLYFQVNNACSTGSSALLLAKQLVEGGMANCVMALGFEKMERGSLMAKVNSYRITLLSSLSSSFQ